MEDEKGSNSSEAPVARRSFLTGMGTGMTLIGTAAAVIVPSVAAAQTTPAERFQPARLRDIGVTARCFYLIRSQVQYLASSYMQLVKRHGVQPSQRIAVAMKRQQGLDLEGAAYPASAARNPVQSLARSRPRNASRM